MRPVSQSLIGAAREAGIVQITVVVWRASLILYYMVTRHIFAWAKAIALVMQKAVRDA